MLCTTRFQRTATQQTTVIGKLRLADRTIIFDLPKSHPQCSADIRHSASRTVRCWHWSSTVSKPAR